MLFVKFGYFLGSNHDIEKAENIEGWNFIALQFQLTEPDGKYYEMKIIFKLYS